MNIASIRSVTKYPPITFTVAKKIAIRLTKAMNCDGFNIVQNNKPAAGQTVFHFHIHLIPRYNDDGQRILWKPGKLTDEAREEILTKYAAAGE